MTYEAELGHSKRDKQSCANVKRCQCENPKPFLLEKIEVTVVNYGEHHNCVYAYFRQAYISNRLVITFSYTAGILSHL